MKKLYFIIPIILLVSNIFGQSNIELKFTGYFGTNWIQLDSVKIENSIQSGDTMLYYPDTTLLFTNVGLVNNLNKIDEFNLNQNYPNPVLDKTSIKLYVPEKDKVVIKITDILGREYRLHEQILEPGYHSFVFTPGDAKTYILSASWRGYRKNIKVINQGNRDGSKPSLYYSAKTGNIRLLKFQKSSKGINFNVGDSLIFTGYSFPFVDIKKDTFGVSTIYTFQFHEPTECYSSFIDARDSNVYTAVQIGSQCWMAENLAYLPSVSPSDSGCIFGDSSHHMYVYGYQGTSVTAAKSTPNYQIYGVLYNWYAAMKGDSSSNNVPSGVQGACPTGWHFPSKYEWDTLVNYLGGDSIAGGKMKESGTTHWLSPNTGATNSSGFTALPGGIRHLSGTFMYIGHAGFWVSSTEHPPSTYYAWFRRLCSFHNDVDGGTFQNWGAGSVRCLKD